MRKENRLRTIIAPYSVLFFLYSAQAGAEPTVKSGGLSLKRLSVETPAGAEGDIAFASETPRGNANAGISVTRPPFSASLLFDVTGDRFNGGDSLTAAEPDDFWFFSVPADRTILFQISSSNPDYIVELYEIDWTTATAYPTSVGGYAGSPVANNGLPAGDWALRVYSAGALGNTYTIKLNAANPRGASSIRSLSGSYLQAVLGYPNGDIYANGSYVVTVGGTNAHLDWKREFYFPWDGNYESRTHSIYSAKILNVSAPVSYTSSYASSTNAILIYLNEGTGFMHHQSSFRSGPPVQYYSSFVDTIGKTTPRWLDSDDLTNWGDQILIYDLNTGKPIDFFSVLNFYYASGVEAVPTITWLN